MAYAVRWGLAGEKGRGVFAEKAFRKDEVIEVCPCLPLQGTDLKKVQNTILADYAYRPWADLWLLALGLGSLINHADKANAWWDCSEGANILVIRANRTIKKGEEITINYEGNNT